MGLRVALVLGCVLSSIPAMAGRHLDLFSMEVKSSDFVGRPRGFWGDAIIHCQNLSPFVQTVTIGVSKTKITSSLVILNPSGIGSWTLTTPGLDWYHAAANAVGDRTHVMALGPKGTATDDLSHNAGASCTFMKSGLVCGPSAPPPEAWDFASAAAAPPYCTGTNCAGGGTSTYQFRLSFDVAEDRGAILCGLFSAANLHYGTYQVAQTFNMPINGGRPF